MQNRGRLQLQHCQQDIKRRNVCPDNSAYLMSLTRFNINLNVEKSQRYGRARARSEPDTRCWATRVICYIIS